MLSMYVSSHQRDWDEYLPYVLFAYRTSIHSGTNESPFMLIHGRDAYLPEDIGRFVIHHKKDEQETTESYKQKLLDNFAKIYQEVRYYDKQIKQKRERQINEYKKEHTFKIGDLVWVYNKKKKKGL
jgi:hypothetical protein